MGIRMVVEETGGCTLVAMTGKTRTAMIRRRRVKGWRSSVNYEKGGDHDEGGDMGVRIMRINMKMMIMVMNMVVIVMVVMTIMMMMMMMMVMMLMMAMVTMMIMIILMVW